MHPSQARRAVGAAVAIASSLGLAADDAVVLQDSNKLTLRLLPCDVVARVAPEAHGIARFEVEVARRLAASGGPVARLDPRVEPRVHERDGFTVSFWTHHEPVPGREAAPAEYAGALARLHAGARTLDVPAPRFTERVEQARRLLEDRDRTPGLPDADRDLLSRTVRTAGRAIGERGGAEQLLHGEPHPGNLLVTGEGLLFVDFETCCRGPVEFDLAHAPEEVAENYPGVDRDVLRECRALVLAIITTWRWDRDDRLPDGRRLAGEWLTSLRAELDRHGFDG
ncbi:phosphotransferase enzyme family protein [Kineococcus auxinigenes]|uniref:phosphotransferase enzyme family protein n=1 Tax=unclassified Kineococcus TaxID=2621656 RepID=UPI003D7EFA70